MNGFTLDNFKIFDSDNKEREVRVQLNNRVLTLESDLDIFDNVTIIEKEIIKGNLNVRYTPKIQIKINLDELGFVEKVNANA